MNRGTSGDRIPDPLTRRVRSTPDRVALVDADGGRTWRYDELATAVTDTADRLGELGLEAGAHLGLLAGTSVDVVRLIHAAWRRGLVLVPLNVRLAEAELDRQAGRADLDALVCAADHRNLGEAVADVPVVPLGRMTGTAAGSGGREAPEGTLEPVAEWSLTDTALLLFTSGTTGPPKAVRLTMGNLLASATASAFRLGVRPTDRWLLCLPVYHMGGLAPVLRSTHYGTGLVVREGFDAVAVTAATHDHRVTGLSLVPTMLNRVLHVGAPLADSVRVVLLGGAPVPRALVERCEDLGVPVHPTYGLTETASQVATAPPEQAFAHPGTVGQPLLGTTVTVVDEAADPLPPGTTGELIVDGPTVSPGYYGDARATGAAFGPWGFRTGDRGYVDEAGRLWVVGRLDDVIVTGGENVQPGAVERALTAHDAVDDAAVVGLDDPDWGQRVVALVVPGDGERPSDDALIDHCRGILADFEVPKAIAFAGELPRTASGTVDRSAVREYFAG